MNKLKHRFPREINEIEQESIVIMLANIFHCHLLTSGEFASRCDQPWVEFMLPYMWLHGKTTECQNIKLIFIVPRFITKYQKYLKHDSISYG